MPEKLLISLEIVLSALALFAKQFLLSFSDSLVLNLAYRSFAVAAVAAAEEEVVMPPLGFHLFA